MENNENNKPINLETQEKEKNELKIDSSFCEEFSGVIGKDLFKEERENELTKNKIKETVLDKKLFEKANLKNTKISYFIQSSNLQELKDSLNLSLTDENKKESKNKFLHLRQFPHFETNEFDKIKKRVGNNLLNITNFLLHKKIKFNLYEINANKKIGPLLPLTRLIEQNFHFKPEFQNDMQKKYLRLKNYICNYRTIYGDGNCFYRAVMFRYMELLILNKKHEYIKLLIQDINKCYSNPETKSRLVFNNQQINSDLIIQVLIIIYELVENNKIFQAHQALYKAILCSKDFDFLLIFYFRFILYDYIKNNENKLYMENFSVLIGNLLPSIYEKDGVFDFNSFYQNYLLKMFIPAEKIIVYLTPFVLGINLEIVLFDDNEEDIVKHFKYCEDNNDKNLLNINQTIFLINRKYHYENVFNFFDNKNFNDVYQYYRNDVNPIFIKEDNILSNLYLKIKKNNINNANNNNANNNYSNNNHNNKTNNTNIINNFNNNANKNYQNNNIINNNNNNTNIKKNEYHTKVKQVVNTNNNNNMNFNDRVCLLCSSPVYIPNKTIKNICKSCLFKVSFSQIKKYYTEYIKLMFHKINQVTQDDLYNSFLNKIRVNVFEKIMDINQIIEEIDYSNINKPFINQLMADLKKSTCLYCCTNINETQSHFQLPCGCNFCSGQHLHDFFKKLVADKFSYNYKCICAIEYKPYQILELCNFLRLNNIYTSNDKYIKHLSDIFKHFCCKCGSIKNKLIAISVDNTVTYFHNICEECTKGINANNKILHCLICNKKHTYI